MRNFLLLINLFLCAPALLAAPFGFLDGSVPRSGEGSPFALLRKITRGEPVCIQLDNQTEKEENAFYLEKIQQAYARWFSETWKQIVAAKRTAEFEDVRDLLTSPPVSVAVAGEGCSTPDLKMYVVSARQVRERCAGALACVVADETLPKLYFAHRGGLGNWLSGGNWNVLMHELGHTLGLADQYKYGRSNSSAQYHTPDSGKGMMSAGRVGMKFSCDDADGMINLLDVAVFKQARGGAGGWRSLCKKRAYKYVNGRPSSNDKYVVEAQGEDISLLEFDSKGALVQERLFSKMSKNYLFNLQATAPLAFQETNPNGQVIYEKRADGKEMFCSYTYEKKECLFLQNGELIATLSALRQPRKGSVLVFYLMEPDGQKSAFVYKGQGKNGTLSYEHGPQTTYFSVNKNGVQPNVPSEPPAVPVEIPFAVMGEENAGKNLSQTLRARTQRAIEAAKQTREFRQADRFFKRFVKPN